MSWFKKQKKYEEGENPPSPPKDNGNGDGDGSQESEGEMDYVGYMKYMDGKIDKICSLLEKLVGGGGGSSSSDGAPPASSLAMQSDKAFLAYQESTKKEISMLYQKIEDMEKQRVSSDFDKKLRSICAVNKTLNYEAEKEFIDSIEGAENKKRYLTRLMNDKIYSHSSNYASEQLQRISFEADSISKKYQNHSPQVRHLVKELCASYEATAKQHKTRFTRVWPSQEKFVEYFLENEERTPGFIEMNLN